jgi:hypothetical protein
MISASRIHPLFILAFACSSAAALFAQEQPAKELPFGKMLLRVDFRGNADLPDALKKVPRGDFEDLNQPDDKGLRITIPKSHAATQPVGVALMFPLTGDFEITAGFEALTIDRPTSGAGVGVALNVCVKNDYKKFGKVGRFMLAQKGSTVVAESWDKDVKGSYKIKTEPTETRAGQVRLVRRGSKLHYFVAEAPGNAFREIHTSEFSADDVELVRFAVSTNGAAAAADVRLTDLTIRTVDQDPPPAPRAAADPDSDPPAPSKSCGRQEGQVHPVRQGRARAWGLSASPFSRSFSSLAPRLSQALQEWRIFAMNARHSANFA